MTEETNKADRLLKLQGQLLSAKRECEAWKGKHTVHYEMACLLVEGFEKEIRKLSAPNGGDAAK
jgi:hypothetical protein